MERKGDLDVILIGLGANLPSRFGPPRLTLVAAVKRLEEEGVRITRRSRFWRTRPVPESDQPWFVNAVVAVETDLTPAALLALLHRIEADFGRVRAEVNAPRLLDLDLLSFGRVVLAGPEPPILPHPRLARRAFTLLPIRDIAPGWVHPVTGESLDAMVATLDPEQKAVAEE